MADIKLRPISLEDTDNIVKWRNEDFVRFNLYSSEPITAESHINYFNKYIATGKVKQYIINADNTEDIGTIFFKNIDQSNSKAEVGIFIGNKNSLGGGYGTISLKSAVSIAFETLKLNKIYATIFKDNIASVKLFKKVGFNASGFFEEDFFDKNTNTYKDVIYVELTQKMWFKKD